MSTPWCHATVARAAPHVSLNDVTPSTGNTYGPPESGGVPFCGGPPVHGPLPKVLPLACGVVVTGAGSGCVTVVVAAGTGIVAGGSAGAGSVCWVTVGGGSGAEESVVSVTVVVVSVVASGTVVGTVVVSVVVVVVGAVVVGSTHSTGGSPAVVAAGTVPSSQSGASPATA